MKTKFRIISNILLLFIILSVIFSGCSKKNQSPTPEQQSMEGGQSGEPPEVLKEIEDSIEKIIGSLNGPAVMSKESQAQAGGGNNQSASTGNNQSTSSGNENQMSNSQGGTSQSQGSGQKQGDQKEQSSSGNQGNKSSGQQTPSSSKTQQKSDPWQTVTPTINNLHYQWNSFMPSAVKMGANKALLDTFSTSLNGLTNAFFAKNTMNTLLDANRLYANIPDFFALYKTSVSPEIKRIRYYTRNVMLNAMITNWTQADTDINNLKSTWSIYKNTIPQEHQEDMYKLDFSIMELETVVKEKNQALVNIKGRVALANVQSLEKAMEKPKSQTGQESK